VLKSYRVVSIHDRDFNTELRRMVLVEIERTTDPDKPGEAGTTVETFVVQYPAYGKEHYTASVEFHPDGNTINHMEATAVSSEIKLCVGKYNG